MRNKKALNAMSKNYYKIPIRLNQLGLPIGAFGLYTFIAAFPEEFDPSNSFMAAKLKISRNTVKRNLTILETCCIIRKYQVGGKGKSPKYEFRPPVEWKVYDKKSRS